MANDTIFSYTEDQLRKYTFPCEKLPCHSCSEKVVNELIASQKPVVIKGTNLVSSALKWDLEYLQQNIGSGMFTVYQSSNHVFKYFDEKKKIDNFVPPMLQKQMSFKEFCDIIKKPNAKKRYYLQQPLTDKVGPEIVKDFVNCNWSWVGDQQTSNNWGPLTSNLLLISQEGNVTPCHYDEQENFYAQVNGLKRVILFPPEQYECLYPHPVYHPHDRQSQVNFDEPDFMKFPKFQNAKGFEAVLGPGDVLYLPSYWFHHFETLLDSGLATAMTFWYKAAPVGQIEYPLKISQKMAMMRNIEKMICEALVDYKEVDPFWRMLVVGRYVPDTSILQDQDDLQRSNNTKRSPDDEDEKVSAS